MGCGCSNSKSVTKQTKTEVLPIEQCFDCATKHICTVLCLMQEYEAGYESNRAFIIGELALVEWHTRGQAPNIAEEARRHRLHFQKYKSYNPKLYYIYTLITEFKKKEHPTLPGIDWNTYATN